MGGESSGIIKPNPELHVTRWRSVSSRPFSWRAQQAKTKRLASERVNSNTRTTTATVLSVSWPVVKMSSWQCIADSMNGEATQARRIRAIKTWNALRLATGNFPALSALVERTNMFTAGLYRRSDVEPMKRSRQLRDCSIRAVYKDDRGHIRDRDSSRTAPGPSRWW